MSTYIGCFVFGRFEILSRMWEHEDAKRLGETLKHLRVERRLSQEALAYQAGITKNQLQLIEAGRASGRRDDKGHSNPRMATLAGLAGVLEMSVADLLRSARL